MARLQTLKVGIAALSGRSVSAPAKTADPLYQTPEFKIWRAAVVARASGQCEAVENGRRCPKSQPRHRMFADHIHEVKDGGALFDVANGECLCGAHHSAKTAQARALRRTTP